VKTTHLLAIAAVVFNVAGNYCLSVGMKQTGELVSVSPLDYLRVLLNPWVAVGVGLLFGWLIAQLSLLSWADLTWVLPITALGYALPAVLGAALLHERVHPVRWAGITLIVAGVGVVIRTIPRSRPAHGELR
jgi:multidrug transporter EmrE-like cation transporter